MCIVFLYLLLTCWHSHFQCWKFLRKILRERYLTNEYSYRADFTDLDTVYGSDERLKRKFIKVKYFLIYLEKCLSQLIMKQTIVHNSDDWVNPLECFFNIKGHATLDSNWGLWYNILGLQLIPRHCHRHYPAFYTIMLHWQTPTLMFACQAWRHFVLFWWWSLVWPSWGMNPWPTAYLTSH